ncbi:MAG: hypothetical protein RLZZ502_420 [Pseudomonadota bacterium]
MNLYFDMRDLGACLMAVRANVPPARPFLSIAMYTFFNFILCHFLAALMVVAHAQTWPAKPIKLLVGFPAGTTPDMSARLIAEPLSKALGQPVVVENKPGNGGNISADLVAKATDHHTFGIASNGNLTAAQFLNPNLPFNPAKDFRILPLLSVAPFALVVAENMPVGKEFVERARVSGDKWNYGSVGLGSMGHLGLELIKSKLAGFQAQHVPFPGNPQVITALLNGQIQMALIPPGSVAAQVKAGKLKIVGITGGKSALAPELLPLSELGVGEIFLEAWTGLMAPAGLSNEAFERMNTEVQKLFLDDALKQKYQTAGWQAVGSSGAQFKARVEQEAATFGRLIKERNIKAE